MLTVLIVVFAVVVYAFGVLWIGARLRDRSRRCPLLWTHEPPPRRVRPALEDEPYGTELPQSEPVIAAA